MYERSVLRIVGIAAVGALLAATSVLSGSTPARAAFNDSDGDGTIDVAELIAGSDPHDPASTPESVGGSIYVGLSLCTDGIDNDLDGLTDLDDPGCVDTDGDLVDDPIELALGSDPNDMQSIPEHSMLDAMLVSLGLVTFQCTDGLDNDLDGLVDAADPGCAPFDSDEDGFDDVTEKTCGSDPDSPASSPEREDVNPGSCSDGEDNDGDSTVDGDDPGCEPATPTRTPAAEAIMAPTPGTSAPHLTPSVGRLPDAGAGPSEGRSIAAYGLMAAGGVAAGATALGGAAWYARGRRSSKGS